MGEVTVRREEVNGQPGAVILTPDGMVISLMVLDNPGPVAD